MFPSPWRSKIEPGPRFSATLRARFGGIDGAEDGQPRSGHQRSEPGSTRIPQLHLEAPRLWWPNGYGPANLYRLDLEASADGAPSDRAELNFGIRELTYELSLFDSEGRLRRVEVDPALGTALGQRLVDVRHEAIKRTPHRMGRVPDAGGRDFAGGAAGHRANP